MSRSGKASSKTFCDGGCTVKMAVVVALLFVSVPAYSQSNYAALSGTVVDPEHRAIAGATIQLTSVSTGAERTASTNDQGIFQIPGLLPGDYRLVVKALGFAEADQALRLEVAQQLSLDLSLKLGSVANVVEVNAESEILHKTDAGVGEVIEPTSIANLPLNGRMLIDLVLTVPGAHVSHGAQAGDMNPLYWRPGQRSAVSIGGNRPNANYFLLDGTTNTDPTFNTMNLSPSPDAVQEFKVQTGSYSAEMGGAGGGQINIVTRSGSNAFHGTAYDFLRNGAMDAYTFGAMGSSKFLVQNNFGGSVGGPLLHSKTFFFFNYEGYRHSQADSMTETVPTPQETAGNFQNSGVTIYDPYNVTTPGQPASPTNPRLPFLNNSIPQQDISSAAQLFLQNYVPQPNIAQGMMACGGAMMGTPGVVGAGVDCNNYLDVRDEHHVNDQGTARVDQIFSSNSTLAARYSLSSEHGFMPINLPGFGTSHDDFSQQGSLAWNRILAPTLVNIGALTLSRLSMSHFTQSAYTNDIVSQLGILGIGFGGPGAWGAPCFNVQGYSGMGDTYAATPMRAWDTTIEGRDALSWQRGRHSFKFGGSFRDYIWPMWGFFENRGYYQFTSGYTTQTGTNDGTGSALASFLLGLPVVKQRQAGIPQMQLRAWSTDGFIEDRFELTRSTTLAMGVRYEYARPLHDIAYTNTNLTFESGNLEIFIGGQNGYPDGLLYSNKHNFAPRFGISHNFSSTGVVLHAAYGIFFTPVDLNTWCNQRHNVPFVFPETQQFDNFNPPASLLTAAGTQSSLNFNPAVLGSTTVSFTAFDPHAPAQYVQQWSSSLEKSLGRETTLEIGYLGARGRHLQRAALINNAPPGPGPLGPRRPLKILEFVNHSVLPSGVAVSPTPPAGCPAGAICTPVGTINLLANSAESWYDAGYVNLRRRYAHGLSLVANYTFSKSLSNAPDFRSPMFEAAIPQNPSDLAAEKGLACDIRQRFALSIVYNLPGYGNSGLVRGLSHNWALSSVYQVQTGFPLTISVFGDTANAGTVLGENPIRPNLTGRAIFGPGTHTAEEWFNPLAFAVPPAFTFGDVGRNTVIGPGIQTLDFSLAREFHLVERMKFQVRAEFFNALNKVNLGTPDRFVNTPQFSTITEAATPARQIQLGARLSF